MSGDESIVSKGRFLKEIDRRLKRPTLAILNELKSPMSLFKIALETAIARPTDEHHIDEEVLGNEWWAGHANKEQIVRFGYIEAVSLSLQHAEDNHSDPLPIESLWFSGASTFEVVVTKSDTHISLLLVTPAHPAAAQPVEVAFPEDIWVVSGTERCAEIKVNYGAEYAGALRVEDVSGMRDGDIKRLRIWGA